MPVYEYECGKCAKKFELTMTFAEYGKAKVRCPKCKSLKVSRRISAFFAQTNKKS